MTDSLVDQILRDAEDRHRQTTPTTAGSFGAGTSRHLCYEAVCAVMPERPAEGELPAPWLQLMDEVWPDGRPDMPLVGTTQLPFAVAGVLADKLSALAST